MSRIKLNERLAAACDLTKETIRWVLFLYPTYTTHVFVINNQTITKLNIFSYSLKKGALARTPVELGCFRSVSVLIFHIMFQSFVSCLINRD